MLINLAANANDHENQLQHIPGLVKNASQLQVQATRKIRVVKPARGWHHMTHDDT